MSIPMASDVVVVVVLVDQIIISTSYKIPITIEHCASM